MLWAVMCLGAMIGGVRAQEVINLPNDYQLGFQDAATPNMVDIAWMHDDILLPIITVITVFVLALLLWVMIRFNAKANPTPSRTTHHTMVEVVWTVVPIMILVGIAIPSFKILYSQQSIPEADMTIKATGHQWYWSYEYPDHGGFAFDSLMLQDEERSEDQPRLLAVDNAVVVPAGATVRVQVTADDVIHNWAMPAFGVKMDAIPGRLNETWFKVDKPGIYYGMCSELCGSLHAFMPIEVRVLERADFDNWLENARVEFAATSEPNTNTRTAALTKVTQVAR